VSQHQIGVLRGGRERLYAQWALLPNDFLSSFAKDSTCNLDQSICNQRDCARAIRSAYEYLVKIGFQSSSVAISSFDNSSVDAWISSQLKSGGQMLSNYLQPKINDEPYFGVKEFIEDIYGFCGVDLATELGTGDRTTPGASRQ
jgi:hypothetical protein